MRRGGGAGRVVGVDVARGFALLGMAATHIFPESEPDGSMHPAHLIAAGRASALFAVLAGVSLSLVVARSAVLARVRVATVVRSALLLLLGLALGAVESPPLVILAYYALLFLVSVPLLGLPMRVLAVLAVGWALLSPVLSQLVRSTVVDSFVIDEPGGRGIPVQLAVSGVYPVLTWTTYLLVGLAVGRLALREARVATVLVAVGVVAAIGARLLSALLLDVAGGRQALVAPGLGRAVVDRALDAGLFGVTPTSSSAWLLVAAPHSGTTLDLVGTSGSAVAVLGVCLLFTGRGAGPLFPVAAAGSMTLTLYTLHVLALRTDGPFLLDDRLELWLVHAAVALVLATGWRLVLGRGPLEAVSTTVSTAVARATVRA